MPMSIANNRAMAVAVRYSSGMGLHEQLTWLASSPVDSKTPLPLLPDYRPERLRALATAQFNDQLVPLRRGRFYPAQVLRMSQGPAGALFRVRRITEEHFQADFNHPVSVQKPQLHCVGPSQVPTAALGRMENVLRWAGIEAPLPNQLTDFTDADRFERLDTRDDADFYAEPRCVHHLDGTCRGQIELLYDRLLPASGVVIDLMSSWRSHLPVRIKEVIGLGMNAQEMADNAVLAKYLVHDLNRSPKLPFATASMAAVVNTASIEYLVHPQAVLTEVRRILRPGGIAIFTFSNRYFPSKAIKLWIRLHPVERLGWVAQGLHDAGLVRLQTYVEQGLARAADDRYAQQLTTMDPLLAAWGYAPPPAI